MKISLIAVGETKARELQESVAEYSKRLSHYTDFEFVTVSEEKLSKIIEKADVTILLDKKGKEYSSVGFSQFIEKQLNTSVKNIAFVIGGPFGFSEEVRAKSDALISLSKMTLPHDLVRIVFMEQLYRAFTILRNEKYHHG